MVLLQLQVHEGGIHGGMKMERGISSVAVKYLRGLGGGAPRSINSLTIAIINKYWHLN